MKYQIEIPEVTNCNLCPFVRSSDILPNVGVCSLTSSHVPPSIIGLLNDCPLEEVVE